MAFNPTLRHLTTRLDGGVVWAASTEYLADNVVIYLDASYRCLVNHTAGSSFVTDLLANKWVKLSASEINYIANSSALVDTSGYSAYADAAGAAPVDGAGGSPSVTFTRSTTSPLRGIADFNFTKPAGASHQGNGVSYDFTIDNADLAKVLTVTFDYEVVSGTYADGDLTVYIIQDPTGTPVVIQPAGYTIMAGTAGTKLREIATFQTASNVTSYRLCFHCASSTNTSAYVIAMDNISVSPQSTVQGAAVSDFGSTPWTPVSTWNAGTTVTGTWRRVGDELEGYVKVLITNAGLVPATNLFVNLPSGYTIDTSKLLLGGGGYATTTGRAELYNASGGAAHTAQVFYNAASQVGVFYTTATNGAQGNVTPSAPFSFINNSAVHIYFSVPISGWSSNTVLSQDTDTRVIAASVYRSGANQSVSGSSDVKIQWNGKNNDSTASFDSTTNYRWTNPVSGIIKGSGFIGINATAASAVILVNLYKNGSPVKTIGLMSSSASTSTSIPFSFQIALNAGDYLEMYVNPSGQTIAIQGDSTIYNGSQWNIERISGPATIAASETVAAYYVSSAGNQVTNGATNYIDFPTRVYDTHGMAIGTGSGNVTTSGTGFRVIIPVSGKYYIYAKSLSTSGGGWAVGEEWTVGITVNGTVATSFANLPIAAHTTFMNSQASGLLNLVAGDRVELFIFQSSGAPLNMNNGAANNAMFIYRVGN